MIKNAKLHEALRGLLSKFLSFLEEVPKDLEAMRSKATPMLGNVYAVEQFGLIEEVRRILKVQFKSIEEWSEYEALKECFEEGFPYQRAIAGQDAMGLIDLSFLPSLIRLFMICNTFQPNFGEKAFERMYEMLENGLYADMVEFWVRAPLHGIALESDEVSVTDDLNMRKIEKEDFESLVLHLDRTDFVRPFSSPVLSVVGIVNQKLDRKENRAAPRDAAYIIRRFAAVLSVFARHRVEVGQITAIPKDHWTFMSGIASSHVPDENPFMHDFATLKTEDIDSLSVLWKNYQEHSPTNPWLDFALERLHRSFFTVVPEERIVDFVTILEIFYSHDSTSELRYKFAIRIAFSLEKEKNKRIEMYQRMLFMYDVRSSIVHSGKVDNEKLQKIGKGYGGILPFVAEMEEIVFRSCALFINDPKARNDIQHVVFS